MHPSTGVVEGVTETVAEDTYVPPNPISLSPFTPKVPTSLQKQLELDFGFQRLVLKTECIVCPTIIGPIYIVTYKIKKGQDFLDRQYINNK